MRGNQKFKGRLGSGGGFFLHWNHDVNEAAITGFKGRESEEAALCLQSLEEWHFYWKSLISSGNSMLNE